MAHAGVGPRFATWQVMAEPQPASVPPSSRLPGALPPFVAKAEPIAGAKTLIEDVLPAQLPLHRGNSRPDRVASWQPVSPQSFMRRQARALPSILMVTSAVLGAAALALTMLTPLYLAVSGLSGCGSADLLGLQLPGQWCADAQGAGQDEFEATASSGSPVQSAQMWE